MEGRKWALETPQFTYTIRTHLEHCGGHSTPPGWKYRLAIRFAISKRDSELKTAINQKLWALARDGVTDPVELREWALENLRLR